MIVVKVDLDSYISPARDARLFTMIIANDGTGTKTRGNYRVLVGRRNQTDLLAISRKPWRTGEVKDYPRTAKHSINLIAKALESVI